MSAVQAAPLLSAQWFRVAALRPSLEPQAKAERVPYRREVWHVLVGPDGRRSFRLNRAAWALVARCDGHHTVQKLWDLALAEGGDDAPTQDELLQILSRLHQAGLLSFDRRPDFGTPTPNSAIEPEDKGHTERRSLLSFRIPLGSPDPCLTRLAPLAAPLFTRSAFALWLFGVLAAALAALPQAPSLAAQLQAAFGSPHMLWLAWLAYPVIKALHELAHGLAVRHWGGRVAEWGVTLLMFVPVPYVDASAASAFASRRQRLMVAAAGIVVELAVAALGLAVALATESGVLHDLALVAFAIGALSTLLVNANPLMRFDGYHMLCDALELPNLALRSSRHWQDLLRERLLGLRREASIVPATGETPWLWAYAPAALVLRWAVALAAVNWLGAISFLLGTAIALYFGWMLLAKPLLALLRLLHGPSLQEAERSSARKRTRWLGLALLVPLAALPLPQSTVVQGVLWLPEQALVRAQTDGFVEQVLVADGQPVQAGDPLLTLRAPALLADQERAEGRVLALQSERYQALRDDPAQAVAVEHELQAASAELEQLAHRVEQLTVRAQLAGTAVIAHSTDLPGRFVARGTLLGHLQTDAPGIVRVAIAQDRAAWISAHRGHVEVRLAEPGAAPLRGQLVGAPSGGGAALPSAALGERSGGRIAVDPADRHGLTPVQPVLLADVRLEQPAGERIGQRALVRFEHGRAPIAWQAARALQQQVLEHFNPAQ